MKTIDDAVQYAAGNLPIGYEVEIAIENGGYNVRLLSDGCKTIQIDENDIVADIIYATDLAIRREEQHGLITNENC